MNLIQHLVNEKKHEIDRFTSSFLLDEHILSKYGLTNVNLRPYQLDGVKWMIARYECGMGCILADEMGLGKTCQTIAFLLHLYNDEKCTTRSFILSPLSVLNNWKNELTKFAPSLKFLLYVGDKEERSALRKTMLDENSSFHILLTSYEICLNDQNYLMAHDWLALVVDEAHRLKNSQSLLHIALKQFTFKYHLLLTGTPIQNNLTELYSLLSFISPNIFEESHLSSFLKYYENILESKNNDLKAMLEVVMLRRLKSDVLSDIPLKQELILYHSIVPLQLSIYKAILSKNIEFFDDNLNLNSTASNKNRAKLNNILMQLRKCVCHPYLFDGVEPEPFKSGDHLFQSSGKLLLLHKLLKYLQMTNHKVLLFSQFTSFLDIVQDYLTYQKINYERLDGSVRSEERNIAVNNFNNDQSTFIFLLSTKAGGQGLNLTSADTVIFLDQDFNPHNDLQAAARAHRIGQKRNVKVIRLVGQSTVEEITMKRARKKLLLTDAVMTNHSSTNQDAKLEKIDVILKFGLDKLFAGNKNATNGFHSTNCNVPNDDNNTNIGSNSNNDNNMNNDIDSDASIDFENILGCTKDGQWMEDLNTRTKKTAEIYKTSTKNKNDYDINIINNKSSNDTYNDVNDGDDDDDNDDDGGGDDGKDGRTRSDKSLDDDIGNMYIFQGKDYSKIKSSKKYDDDDKKDDDDDDDDDGPSKADLKYFEKLKLEAELENTDDDDDKDDNGDDKVMRSCRQSSSMMMSQTNNFKFLTSPKKKKSKPLTAEELEQQKQKRLERMKLIADAKEAERLKKIERKKKRLQKLWDDNDYKSCKISDDEGGDDNDGDEESDDDDDDDTSQYIHYIVGDVTKPVKHHNHHRPPKIHFLDDNNKDDIADDTEDGIKKAGPSNIKKNLSIVLHCTDNSGQWGRGGLFTCIDSRSLVPRLKYKKAFEMEDLNLGDVHLFSLKKDQNCDSGDNSNSDDDDEEKEDDDSETLLAILVVQSRLRNNSVSPVDLKFLEATFVKLSKKAKSHNASIHCPRFGHHPPSTATNWYTIERLIKKYFSSNKIHASIYYYSKNAIKNKNCNAKRKVDDSNDTASSSKKTKTANIPVWNQLKNKLSDFMNGVAVYFHEKKETQRINENEAAGEKDDHDVIDENDADENDLITLLRELKRHVIAYGGIIHENLQHDTTHVVTFSKNREHLLNHLQISKQLGTTVVDVMWLIHSIKQRKLLQTDNYLLHSKH